MISNNSLTKRIEKNIEKWEESTNYDYTCKFGRLPDFEYDVTSNFSYLIDMKTLEAIESGNFQDALEYILQVNYPKAQIELLTLGKSRRTSYSDNYRYKIN